MPELEVATLTGWGRTAPSVARVRHVHGPCDLFAPFTAAGPRGVIARGLGRSYGDAAQNGGGDVIDATGLDAPFEVDAVNGTVRVGAGTSIDELLRRLVPAGWFVPVTPGTRAVTVGGAIAADIHGKNHHADGSIAHHVVRMTLHAPIGRFDLSPADDPELFWATAGGMGLTGVITEATLRLRRIETSAMVVETTRVGDLDGAMAALRDADDRFQYSVAWIDCLARGPALGRSVLTFADHAPADALGDHARGNAALAFAPRTRLSAPGWVPSNLLNGVTVRAFNEAWFRRAPGRPSTTVEPAAGYFHPLDAVQGWNRLYGPAGLRQYQYVVPDSETATVQATLEQISESGVASFLAVLKRFGPRRGGPLSFPIPGWTLALDVPACDRRLAALLDRLDRLVADAGGRVYLAKDSRLPASILKEMYPGLERFREVRTRVDPDARMQSDLGRRLELV